jgi:hypothetical protein
MSTRAPECPRCGSQQFTTDERAALVCISCRAKDREPQGEVVKLFEPAPTQLEGQLNF